MKKLFSIVTGAFIILSVSQCATSTALGKSGCKVTTGTYGPDVYGCVVCNKDTVKKNALTLFGRVFKKK